MPGSSPRSSLRGWWAWRAPAARAAVLATGIMPVGLRLAGHEVLSHAALALAGAGWAALGVGFVVRLVRERERWLAEAGTPEGAGDQWVAGGALAVSALAGAKPVAADDGGL